MEPTTENFDERKATFLKELEDLQAKHQITLGAQQQVVFTASDRFVAAPEPSDGLQDGFKGVDLDA